MLGCQGVGVWHLSAIQNSWNLVFKFVVSALDQFSGPRLNEVSYYALLLSAL